MIHPTAFVDPKAVIEPSVEIGPYCVIGPRVIIGAGTRLLSHIVIEGPTQIGERNLIYSGTCIGQPAQAKKVNAVSRIVIGHENIFREHVTIHMGAKESGTVVGNRNFLMVGSHVGHDSTVMDDVTMANSVALGGHVVVEDGAVIGGLSAIHQFCRVGKMSMIGGVSKMTQDVLPFSMVDGRPARLSGANVVGLKRAGYKPETLRNIRRAIRMIGYSGARIKDMLNAIRTEMAGDANIDYLIRYIEVSKRGVIRRIEGSITDEPGS